MKKKTIVMYAIFRSDRGHTPWLIMPRAKDAQSYVFEHKKGFTAWKDAFVRRILIEFQDKTHYHMYRHEYKRI